MQGIGGQGGRSALPGQCVGRSIKRVICGGRCQGGCSALEGLCMAEMITGVYRRQGSLECTGRLRIAGRKLGGFRKPGGVGVPSRGCIDRRIAREFVVP
jgi:hypothetical protein